MAKKRTDIILDILKAQGYVTVKYLTEQLHYSTATINRDLNLLQKQGLIKRHYGGAELAEHKGVPLTFRYHKMKPAKNIIAKKAAEFINDGDTVFIDASTTTQYIGQYITDRNDLTVITNNMILTSYLSEYGIKCICLGGEVVEIPYMLGGNQTVENARTYKADKFFFATSGITENGIISDSDGYYFLRKIMSENSDEVFYLADHDKVGKSDSRICFDLNDINYVISDYSFPIKLKNKFKSTNFIKVDTPKSQK
ncbi:MAG: DeoR/GlpR transcriptional regulator [Clostridia bacterium]|nr:DeoR/GlpR transcriptional regulator [Clostridia bacterium]